MSSVSTTGAAARDGETAVVSCVDRGQRLTTREASAGVYLSDGRVAKRVRTGSTRTIDC